MRLVKNLVILGVLGSLTIGSAIAQTTATTSFTNFAGIQSSQHITQSQAKKIALLKYPGKVVGSVKSVTVNSRRCYAVDVMYQRKTHRLAIDVENRKVLSDVVIKTQAIDLKKHDKKHWKVQKTDKSRVKDQQDRIKEKIKKHEDHPKVKKQDNKDKDKDKKKDKSKNSDKDKKGKGSWVK
jgi:hypothetical protein